MKNKDYDYLTLYAKKNKVKEVVKNYEIFGWELVSEAENNKYEDILDLSFVRPHKINNKDELQLRQVYMEDRLNELGKLERHKNSKATAFGLIMGPLFLVLLIGAIYLFVKKVTLWAGILSVLSIISLTLGLVFLPKIIKNEKKKYLLKTSNLNRELDEILTKVKQLQEKNHE